MNFEAYITQIVANLTNRLNQIVENARKISELPWQSILRPGSEMQVSNPEGTSEKITVQQILDAALSFRQNQLIVAVVSVDENDVTVDTGAQWVINNINYELASDFEETVPYAETGYTRNDILVADQFNQIHREIGPETEGVSPTPNVPINTVLVTTINVTDSTIGYTPPIIGDEFEVKLNKQNSLATDGTGTKYPTIDLLKTVIDDIDDKLDLKLDIADYNDRFKGVFATEAALIAAWPTANAGDYAQVNEVGATDVVNYNWDAEENIWVVGGSGGGAVNTDALPEGSSNLYWTTARGLTLILTGLSASSGTFTATDTLIFALGKIKYLIDNISSIYQVILTDVNFGAFINALTGKTTPIDADSISIVDSADSNKQKKVSLTNFKAFLKTYFDGLYSIPQITITTAVSITTATNDASGNGQKGRNVIISNGATAINLTVNGGTDFVTSYVKHGTGAITFVQGSGRTLIQVDGVAVLNGAVGSTATISSVGTTDYLRISNA